MLDMLKQTGREEVVVGWYHSHPGFGCWLSSVDMNTHQSFETLSPRAVAVVVDPIQSVRGKVVIDAFRLINPQMLMLGQEPRQTTSVIGHLNKPSIQALIHGLNRHYYSMPINYRKGELEQQMLLSLGKKRWAEGLQISEFAEHSKGSEATVKQMLELAKAYQKSVVDEETAIASASAASASATTTGSSSNVNGGGNAAAAAAATATEKRNLQKVGKLDPKKHLQITGERLMGDNILQVLGSMVDTIAF